MDERKYRIVTDGEKFSEALTFADAAFDDEEPRAGTMMPVLCQRDSGRPGNVIPAGSNLPGMLSLVCGLLALVINILSPFALAFGVLGIIIWRRNKSGLLVSILGTVLGAGETTMLLYFIYATRNTLF